MARLDTAPCGAITTGLTTGPPRVSAIALAMMLADARLPAAGHTQSGGLEPALADGLSAADIPDYCRTRLETVTRTDAATAVVATYVARDATGLAQVERAWAARTPSDAMRDTSRLLGRGLGRLARQVWPEAADLLVGLARPPRPVVLGALAAYAGLPAVDLARLVAYDDVATVVAAALKLAPLDPAVTAGWTWRLLPDVDRLAAELSGLTRPSQIPPTGAPEIEAWAQTHAQASRRLFSA